MSTRSPRPLIVMSTALPLPLHRTKLPRLRMTTLTRKVTDPECGIFDRFLSVYLLERDVCLCLDEFVKENHDTRAYFLVPVLSVMSVTLCPYLKIYLG